MAMKKYLDDALDTVDAAIFTGDDFQDRENIAAFREMMARWTREINGIEAGLEDRRNGPERRVLRLEVLGKDRRHAQRRK